MPDARRINRIHQQIRARGAKRTRRCRCALDGSSQSRALSGSEVHVIVGKALRLYRRRWFAKAAPAARPSLSAMRPANQSPRGYCESASRRCVMTARNRPHRPGQRGAQSLRYPAAGGRRFRPPMQRRGRQDPAASNAPPAVIDTRRARRASADCENCRIDLIRHEGNSGAALGHRPPARRYLRCSDLARTSPKRENCASASVSCSRLPRSVGCALPPPFISNAANAAALSTAARRSRISSEC